MQKRAETRSRRWWKPSTSASTIDELQGSVGQINQILTVIEEITTRTNLLALNAAIIAAQAGEQGLGFGVVADEIRELAERTRGSTKEIAAIIKAVQSGSRQAVAKINAGVERVEANVELAENASSSLQKIVNSAARSYDMATKISRALEEQAAASRHLHDVTSRMSDAIAEINRGTREQARGTELLAQEAERVREIAAQVKSATDEQSQAGHGITMALEKIADDARNMRGSRKPRGRCSTSRRRTTPLRANSTPQCRTSCSADAISSPRWRGSGIAAEKRRADDAAARGAGAQNRRRRPILDVMSLSVR